MEFWEMRKERSKALVITAVLLVLFATALGVCTAGANILVFDLRISQEVQRWQGDFPAILYRTGDMLGSTVGTVIGLVLLIGFAILTRNLRIVAFLVAVVVARLAGTLLKPVFGSPRPSQAEVHIYEIADGTGYPSGHSMTAAMLATIAVVLVWSRMYDDRARWISLILAITLTVLVGWSRVWSGAHWPTDVIGGWSYGIALVLIAWAVTTLRGASGSDRH